MIEDDGHACGKSSIHAHAGMDLSMQQLSGMYRASHGIGLNGLSACLCLGGGGGGGPAAFRALGAARK
jgi:hypothetical protein